MNRLRILNPARPDPARPDRMPNAAKNYRFGAADVGPPGALPRLSWGPSWGSPGAPPGAFLGPLLVAVLGALLGPLLRLPGTLLGLS